jgi:hypothetical protein
MFGRWLFGRLVNLPSETSSETFLYRYSILWPPNDPCSLASHRPLLIDLPSIFVRCHWSCWSNVQLCHVGQMFNWSCWSWFYIAYNDPIMVWIDHAPSACNGNAWIRWTVLPRRLLKPQTFVLCLHDINTITMAAISQWTYFSSCSASAFIRYDLFGASCIILHCPRPRTRSGS